MSISRGMDKDVVHIDSGPLHSHKKNEIMPFAATWMDLEIVILSEVSQTRISYDIPYDIWTLKRNDTNELAKQKETHRLRE